MFSVGAYESVPGPIVIGFFRLDGRHIIKWFKHDTDALQDAKIEKLIMKCGLEGYGLYFACIELIAASMSSDNCSFELEHDEILLAHKFKKTPAKIKEMLSYMVEIGLLQYNEESKRLMCIKLLKRVDNTMAQHPEIKKIQNNGNFKELKETLNNLKLFKADKIRLDKDKIRLDKDKGLKEKEINEILQFYKKLTQKTKMSKVPGEVNARLTEGHTVKEAKYVILYKFLEWWDDRKTKTWVNLTTLFRPSHFEEYLSQAEQGLDELINRRYKRFKKHWYDDNMNKPLEERKKLKLPDFKEYRQKMLGEILEEGNGESSPKTAT